MNFKYSKTIFKLIISLCFVGVLIHFIEWDKFLKLMTSINLYLYSLFLLVGMGGRFLMAYKWNLLLKFKHIYISNLTSLKLYLIGGFLGEFLPTGLGLDLYRIQALNQREKALKDIASSVVVERFLGFLANVSVALISMVIVGVLFDSALIPYILPLFFICFISFTISIILTKSSLQNYLYKLFAKYHSNSFFLKINSFYLAILDYKKSGSTIRNFFLLSVLEQMFSSVIVYVGALALGFKIDFQYFFAFVPAIWILARIPISIQAIGIQEGLFIYFFSHAGLAMTEAFSLALIMRTGNWFVALLGSGLYLKK